MIVKYRTVSIPTETLSSVITGCGGNVTTCSRKSMRGRTRSMNGMTIVSPGSSVRLYRPNRSTTPARACGMTRTVRAAMNSAKTTSTTATISPTMPRSYSSVTSAVAPLISMTCTRAPGSKI